MAIDSNGLLNIGLDSAISTVENNPLTSTVGAAIVGSTLGLGAGAIIGQAIKRKSSRGKSVSSRKRDRRIKHTKRGWSQDRKRRSKQPWEVAYQKRKRKRESSGRRSGKIHYAKKTGQPYIIKANGQARFIKGKRRKR